MNSIGSKHPVDQTSITETSTQDHSLPTESFQNLELPHIIYHQLAALGQPALGISPFELGQIRDGHSTPAHFHLNFVQVSSIGVIFGKYYKQNQNMVASDACCCCTPCCCCACAGCCSSCA